MLTTNTWNFSKNTKHFSSLFPCELVAHVYQELNLIDDFDKLNTLLDFIDITKHF